MHIALIPDGNRRYMKRKGILNLRESYRKGIAKFYDFLDWCSKLNVKEVTIYALSLENMENRSPEEIETLVSVFSNQANDALKDERIHKNSIHINVCGDREYIVKKCGNPAGKELIGNLNKLEDATRENSNMTLNLTIAYGGRQEIINSVKNIVGKKMEINEDNIKNNLWVRDYPDIIIRTAEDRLSNFLLWQSAYSEI